MPGTFARRLLGAGWVQAAWPDGVLLVPIRCGQGHPGAVALYGQDRQDRPGQDYWNDEQPQPALVGVARQEAGAAAST